MISGSRNVEFNEQIYNLLQDFYQLHKDNLECILLGGSKISPFINTHHDTDIVVIWKTKEDRRRYLYNSRDLHKQIYAIDSNYNCLHHYLNQYIELEKWPIYAYLYSYHIAIAGSVPLFFQEFDVLQYPVKIWDSFIDIIELARNKKWFYHILTDIYLLQGNSFDLTEEQIENINIVHDQQDQEKIEELYQWALQQLQE